MFMELYDYSLETHEVLFCNFKVPFLSLPVILLVTFLGISGYLAVISWVLSGVRLYYKVGLKRVLSK